MCLAAAAVVSDLVVAVVEVFVGLAAVGSGRTGQYVPASHIGGTVLPPVCVRGLISQESSAEHSWLGRIRRPSVLLPHMSSAYAPAPKRVSPRVKQIVTVQSLSSLARPSESCNPVATSSPSP